MRQLYHYFDYSEDFIPCKEGHKESRYNRDHVPAKTLLNPPYPENLPVVSMCQECNTAYGRDEEYLAAFISSVICGSTNLDTRRFPVAARIMNHSPRLQRRIEEARGVQVAPSGNTEMVWTPEMERVERVILKNARAHVLLELGQLILEPPSYVRIVPIQLMSTQQRTQFENASLGDAGWPEVGSRLMQRIVNGECGLGGWITVQDETYRYAVSETLDVRICIREYLACEVGWDESADL